MIYMAVLISGLLGSVFKSSNKGFFYTYLFILFVLASFRYGVGPDYFNYEYLYSLVNTDVLDQIGSLTGQELLFRVFGSTLNYINFTYQQYLTVAALVTLFYVGKICKKYSKYPVFSLYLFYCLFYFVWVFSGIRQGLTLAIGVYYLLECLQGRKHIKFGIIVFLLTLIHSSSLILLLFYVLANLKIKRKTLLIGVFFCFCISLIPREYLMGIFSQLPFGERIEFYYRLADDGITISYFDFKSISRFILLVLIGVVFAKNYSKNDETERQVMDMYVASFGIYYALRFVEILAANASIYGFMLIVIILPNMYGKLKKTANSQLFLSFILIFSIAYFFKTLYAMEDMSKLNHSSLITPYTNIFNKSEYFSGAP
jgi:hypothetical protein